MEKDWVRRRRPWGLVEGSNRIEKGYSFGGFENREFERRLIFVNTGCSGTGKDVGVEECQY
jgi:hypothetical protein